MDSFSGTYNDRCDQTVSSGFHVVDSGFQILDSGFFVSETWNIPILEGIPDSLS